jgi:cyanate permease
VNSFTASPQPGPARKRPWWQAVVLQLLRFVLVGFVVGWLYTWSAPWVYRQQSVPGFWLGCAHGALMPMALPSLILKQDVPIYAAINQGRSYKIGYIAGINGCGFVVFGLSFWKPRRPESIKAQ